MISFFYNTLTRFFSALVPFLPLSKKAKQWQQGQKEAWSVLQQAPKNAIWVHVASAGEFEQAKELIELLQNNGEDVVVSFFSPSGYEAQKKNKRLSTIFYLPIDSKKNAKRVIELLQPKLCILVKYDFWLNYMKQLNKNNIPIALVSGVFYENQFLFHWFGREHLKQIKQFKYIAVQDERSKKVLSLQSIDAEVTGDTRIDRSIHLPKENFEHIAIEQFTASNELTIVLGSVWEPDLAIWKERLKVLKRKNIRLMIAPHELNASFLQQIQSDFNAQLLSTYNNEIDSNVLIIDQIGLLKYIYRYADIAYIGGGFGKGIHNTLEPASYGIPVIFGEHYQKFMEAVIMIEMGGAFSVKNTSELYETLAFLMVEENRIKAGRQAVGYLNQYKGASQKVFDEIKIFLKNYR